MSRPLKDRVAFIAAVWKPHRAALFGMLVFTIVSAIVAALYPLALKEAIDHAVRALAGTSVDDDPLTSLLLVLSAIAVGRIVALLYPGYRAVLNARLGASVRARVFDRILDSDFRFRARFPAGDLVTRMTDDIDEHPKLAWFCCSGIFRAFEAIAKTALSIVGMIAISPLLACASLASLPFSLLVYYRVSRRLGAAYQAQQRSVSKTNDVLESAFGGIAVVKAFHAEAAERAALRAVLEERVRHQLAVEKIGALVGTFDALAARAGQVIALGLGALLVQEGSLSLGALYACFVYLDMLVPTLQELPRFLVVARQAFACFDRVAEIENAVAPAEPPSEPIVGEVRIGAIDVQDLSFAYDDHARALEGVSFSVSRGERLAIVGAVGSGKSTLLGVLAGVYAPQAGAVRFDGNPLGWPISAGVRARIGYAPQEPLLLSGSIRWNVAFAREPEDALLAALSAAQLDDDLTRLADGAETKLGAKGARVSGGQRQRIALARALARRPDLLLLDDTTASLDARSEHRLWTALEASYAGLTTIVATHRLATVERADRVLFLERGRVRALATHAELACEEAYRRLFALDDEVCLAR